MSDLSPARQVVTYLRLARQHGMPLAVDPSPVRPYTATITPARPMPAVILHADGVGHRPASGFSDSPPACWSAGRTGVPWPEHGDDYHGPLCQDPACFGGAS